MKGTEEVIYGKAIEHFGEVAQTIVACQKFSALVACLNAELIGRNKVSDGKRTELIADAQIMLNQMKMIFTCCPLCYTEMKERRLKRLKEIMQEPTSNQRFQSFSFDNPEEADEFLLDFAEFLDKKYCRK